MPSGTRRRSADPDAEQGQTEGGEGEDRGAVEQRAGCVRYCQREAAPGPERSSRDAAARPKNMRRVHEFREFYRDSAPC